MVHRSKQSERDSEPWYKQFWPWFIMLLPACAVAASIYTLSLAMRTTDSLVVDSNSGMDVVSAQQIKYSQRAKALGLIADIAIEGNLVRVALQETNESAPLSTNNLVLQFSHPAFAEKDQSVLLLPHSEAEHVYQGTLGDLPVGRWYLILESDTGWRLTGILDESAHTARLSSEDVTSGGHDD